MKKPNPQTCEKCPHRYSTTGCPCWIGPELGMIETNIQTGDERVVVGCYYQVMPKLFIHVIKASNRPAAALESMRNEMCDRQDIALGQLRKLLTVTLPPAVPLLESPHG